MPDLLLTPKLVSIYRNKLCSSHAVPVEKPFSSVSSYIPEELLYIGRAPIAPEGSFLITHLKGKLSQTALLK